MPSTLFTKNIVDITISDIETFYNAKIQENEKVDYKRELPSDLSKYLVGFANKSGGIILIGIEANQTSNIPTAKAGINLLNGLEEKVINQATGNIYPPIYLEVKVFPFKSSSTVANEDKAYVLIRIEESFEAPHMDLATKHIYERIHNETRPADISSIQKMFEKTQKGTVIQNEIFQEKMNKIQHDGFRCFYAYPVTPLKEKIQFNREVDQKINGFLPSRHINFNDYRPILNGYAFNHITKLYNGGVDNDGIIMMKAPWNQDFEDKNQISVEITMYQCLRFLEFIKKVYKYIGYRGKLYTGINFRTSQATHLKTTDTARQLNKDYQTSFDFQTKEFLTMEDIEDSKETVVKIIKPFFRAFGFVPEDAVLRDILKSVPLEK